MATIPCPHPSPLREAQDWYQKQPAKTRRAHGYEFKRKSVKQNYSGKTKRRWFTTVPIALPVVDVGHRFRELVTEWENETSSVSSLSALAAHPKYREIVRLDWPVVPLLIRDLRDNGRFWFPALHEITKVKPFDSSDERDFGRMKAAWLRWGNKKYNQPQ